MAQYQCVRCGAIRESESRCTCSVCGYIMAPSPFDRKEVLRDEIKRFICHLRPEKTSDQDLQCFRTEPTGKKNANGEALYRIILKAQDDQRFPGFQKIRDYVCGANKTEEFHERLIESIEELRKHIHAPYKQSYQISPDGVKKKIASIDPVLMEALSTLGIDVQLPEVEFPEISLQYSETPNEALLSGANELLDLLVGLADKIKRFIRQNNMYGDAYRRQSKITQKKDSQEDPNVRIQRCVKAVQTCVKKNYIVDIFSDGSDELKEMTDTVWASFHSLMSSPLLICENDYTIGTLSHCSVDEVKRELDLFLNDRYSGVDAEVLAYDFLNGKTEDELFTLYDAMIELDSFGIMGLNKHALMKIGESEKKLNEMIGLAGIKESVKKIKAYALANMDHKDLNLHMCFLGNPGTGKTEVARFIAGILYENKILPTKKVVEVDRSGLVSQYFGATSDKTAAVIASALGGVLFVDEAYALGNHSDSTTDYGKEAIDTLVKAMEDYRGKFCVIFAGYRNEMQDMLSVNPGLKSRIQFTLDFPNYSREELGEIADLMLTHRKYTMGEVARNRLLDITDIKRKEANFANAREIRNILDQVIMCQNLRCMGSEDKELGLVDVNKYISDAGINLPTTGEGYAKQLLTGEDELDQLIGLQNVKRMVKKIKAYAKRNKNDAEFNLHMCFYGNPGTGKTEVARILSRILYDAGVLKEAKLVETDGQGLIGKFVGETGPKTLAKINDAMNGVLFIDEAYSLSDSNTASGTSYGDEAIAVLLKEMEDRRGQFCVILAGYKEEMQEMLGANPGFVSRIQFTLEFPDYTREELGEIAKVFLSKKNYTIDEPALERLLDVTEYYRNRPNFANARTVRNILDQVIMNQNLRTEDEEENEMIIIEDVEDYIADEGINLSASTQKRKIGF